MELIGLYLELEKIADRGHEPRVVRELRIVAAEIESWLNPDPPPDSIEVLYNSVTQLEASREGSLVSSTEARVQGGSGDRLEFTCDRLTRVDDKLRRGFNRRRIREFMVQHGFGAYLDAVKPEPSTRCRICNSHLREEVEEMLSRGEALRDISDWLVAQGAPISKDSVHRHARKCIAGEAA